MEESRGSSESSNIMVVQVVQAEFGKCRGTRDQIGSLKKQESFRKISTSALLTMPKPLTVWSTTNSGKFLKTWEYQITLPAS